MLNQPETLSSDIRQVYFPDGRGLHILITRFGTKNDGHVFMTRASSHVPPILFLLFDLFNFILSAPSNTTVHDHQSHPLGYHPVPSRYFSLPVTWSAEWCHTMASSNQRKFINETWIVYQMVYVWEIYIMGDLLDLRRVRIEIQLAAKATKVWYKFNVHKLRVGCRVPKLYPTAPVGVRVW